MKQHKAIRCSGVSTKICDLGEEGADGAGGYRWALCVQHAPPSTQDVLIAWYKTRKDARRNWLNQRIAD